MAGGLQLGAMGLMEDAGPPIVDRCAIVAARLIDSSSAVQQF